MAEQPLDEFEYQGSLDEILFRDPPGAMKHMEVANGISKQKQVITFADGSQLIIAAQVPLPPLADMSLSGQSIAMRMIELFIHVLDGMPEREKVTCNSCGGSGRCLCCDGRGCLNCQGNGRCPSCGGRGVIPKE